MRAKAKRAGPDAALILQNVPGGIAQRNVVTVLSIRIFRGLRLRRIRQRNANGLGNRLRVWARNCLPARRSAKAEHHGQREQACEAYTLQIHLPTTVSQGTTGHWDT